MMGQSTPDMPGAPHAPEVRADALRLLAAGRPAPFVAAQLGIPARTVRLWARLARPSSQSEPSSVPPPDPRAPAPPARPALTVVRAEPAGPPPHRAEERAEDIAVLAVALSLPAAAVRRLAEKAGIPAELVARFKPQVLARAVASLHAPTDEQIAAYVIGAEAGLAKAYQAGDFGAFTRLLSLAARLRGLDRLQVQVEHSGRVEHALSPDELLARRRAVLERVRDLELDS